jgi:hypothetical protein
LATVIDDACVPNVVRLKSSVRFLARATWLTSMVTTCSPCDRSSLPFSSSPVTVTPGARNLTLDFNLTTFGTHASSITVANIGCNAIQGPVAVSDAISVNAGASVLVNVLGNDGGIGLSLTGVTQPTHGSVVIQDGQVLYTAPVGYTGADAFSYTETDSEGQTATANVAVTVLQVLVPPTPATDTTTVVEGNGVLVDVLANDSGTGLTITSATTPAHGSAVIQSGKILYIAGNGYVGVDSFDYVVTDSNGLTGSATVNVTVTAAAPPAADADSVSVPHDSTVLIDVFGNDTGVGLALTSLTPPQFGAATIESGKIRYTPGVGYTGPDSFSYTETDINGQTASTSVAITVVSAVIAPAPATDSATVVQGASALIDVLANDSGTGLTITSATTPAHGTAVLQSGKILYNAGNGYVGADSFDYVVTDSNGLTGSATVNVTVTAAAPPAAAADSVSVPQDGTVLIDGLANDTGVGLALTSVTPPQFGAATIESGKIRYTPGVGYTGPDSFSYTETDINGQTASTSVSITVVSAVIAPAPATDSATVVQGASVLIDVLNNDVGTGLTLTTAGTPGHGTAVIQGGKILYIAAGNYFGADSFSYTVTGQTGLTGTGTVNVTVTEIPPVANPDNATVAAGASVLVDVLANDTGTGITLTSVGTPAHGNASIQNGKLLYTAAETYAGSDTVSYLVTDAAGETTGATLTLTVTSAGTARGDVHMVTFDGLHYDFQAIGDFVLTRSTMPGDTFEIDIATAAEPAWGAVSVTTAAAARVGSDIVTFAAGPDSVVSVNGMPATAMSGSHSVRQLAGGQLEELSPTTFKITWTTGETLTVTNNGAYLDTVVSLPVSMGPGSVQGLLGANSGQANDFQLLDGGTIGQPLSDSELLGIFADAWRLAPAVALADGLHLAHGTPPAGRGTGQIAELLAELPFTPVTGVDSIDSAAGYQLNEPGGSASSGIATAAPHASAATGGRTGATMAAGSHALARSPADAGRDVSRLTAGVTATATAGGLPAAAPGMTAPVSNPSAANTSGGAEMVFDSSAIADALNDDGGLRLAPGLQATSLADGAAGGGTEAMGALAQWLYVGLLGRAYDADGVHYLNLWLANGADKQTIVPDFLGAADFLGRPSAANETALIGAHYADLAGPVRAIGEDWIVATFDDVARAHLTPDNFGPAPALNAIDTAGLAAARAASTSLVVTDSGSDGVAYDPISLAGQTVTVPATASGLPISFASDGTATSVVFTVSFNAALLTITGAVAAAGLPKGATVGFATAVLADGRTQATITVQSPTAIAAGTAALVDLVAQLPATAPHGATAVLSLDIVSVNGVAQALPETSGLQVVGYFGDVEGNGSYSGADGHRILRVVGGADSGFATWSGITPSVVTDLDGHDGVAAADAALAGQTLPAITGEITLVTNSATPFVSAPTSLTAAAGGMVTLSVTLDRNVALTSARITLNYEPTALTLTAVRADPSSGLTVVVTPGAGGTVSVTVSQTTSTAVSGVLALFDFRVANTVQPGTNRALDLSAVPLDGRNLDSEPGAGGTDGRITVLPATVPPKVLLDVVTTGGDTLPATSPTRVAQALLLGGVAA